jgi:UDP-N-acetylmuramate dehydrogenase
MRELRQVPLATLTTLRVGGPARRIVDIESDKELEDVLFESACESDPMFVLGGGSNVIVSDTGWPGTILRPAIRRIDKQRSGNEILLRVGAGEVWDDVVAACVGEGWTGLACLSGIPGWVGAAPIQNIGAYGHEVGQVLAGVRAFDRHARKFVSFSAAECAFGYRNSRFRGHDRHVITELTLRLGASGSETIRYPELARALGVEEGASVPPARARDVVLELRRGKGMVVDEADPESRSAGSFFVNPVVDATTLRHVEACAVRRGAVADGSLVPRYPTTDGGFKVPAAWLIEQSGFRKGMTLGGMGISRKHALALVNRGGTATDLLLLEETIRQGVRNAFGVELSREPILVRYTDPDA